MTTPTLDSFFSGGGGKSISWKEKPLGTTITGTVTAVDPPRQQTDPVDGSLQFKKDKVTPKMSVRIGLATTYRDPADPEDDGSRSLWVQGWLQGAIGDALRKAGVQKGGPEVGGTLTVTLTERTPNEIPALAPTNKFVASYVSPAGAATGQFFAPAPAAQQVAAPQLQYATAPAAAPQQVAPAVQYAAPAVQYAAPPVVAQQYAAPPQAAPQPVQQPVPVAAAPAAIQRPEVISAAAWAEMPPELQAQVAKSISDAPPF